MTAVKPLPDPYIKVCGITRVEDALVAAEAGASAIGLNLWPQSPRSVSIDAAARIAEAVRGQLEIVTVTVDADEAALAGIVAAVAPERLQLHGTSPWFLVHGASLPEAFSHVFHAVGLRDPEDVSRAREAPGCCVLVDAKDLVQHGGTGRAPPSPLAAQVCRSRPTILAGGLGPANVAQAIARVRPVGVDAASGLESAPGVKDAARVRDFVAAAREAFATPRGE